MLLIYLTIFHCKIMIGGEEVDYLLRLFPLPVLGKQYSRNPNK